MYGVGLRFGLFCNECFLLSFNLEERKNEDEYF